MKSGFMTKLVYVLMVVSLLTGCAPQPTPEAGVSSEAPTPIPSAAPTSTPDKLKVSVLSFLSYAPLFIAQEEGYFAVQNLEVKFVKIESAQDNTAALVSGQIDVMTGLVSVGLLNAMSQDVNIKIVADKGYLDPEGCTSTALMARTAIVDGDKLNLTAGQLKTVVPLYGPGSIHEYFFDTLMRPEGVNTTDVKSVQLPFNELAAAMQVESLDFAMIAEPWVTRIAASGAGVIYRDYKQDFPNAAYSTLIFGPSILESKPEVGQRFMVAYLQAVKQYQDGPTDRNIKIVNKYTQLDPAELRQLCWQPMRSDGIVNTQTILDFQEWALAKSYLEQALPVEKFWDPSFVEFAQTQVK